MIRHIIEENGWVVATPNEFAKIHKDFRGIFEKCWHEWPVF
jgi:hypothetical protein